MKRGPKATLTKRQKLEVGAQCATAWETLTDKRTMNPPHMLKIREVQARNRRAKWKFEVQRGSEKIDELLSPKERRPDGTVKRGVSLKVVRPYGQSADVLMQGVAWSWRHYRKRITPEYVRDCWDMFRREQERIMNMLSS